jgi:Putative Ig domain
MPLRRIRAGLITALLLVLMGAAVDKAFAAPLRLTPTTLANGTQYTSYSQTLTASRGTPPYTWALTGSLPPGLTFTPLTSTAVISGVPTVTGTFPFTVTLGDSAGGSLPRSYSITIAASTARCQFGSSGNAGVIQFGNIDPSTPGPIYGNVTTQVQVTCTSNKTLTITVNPASGWQLSGPGTIPYTLAIIPTGSTATANVPVNLFVPSGVGGSTITQANYQNAPAGIYQNNSQINITISWPAPGAGSIVAQLPINSVSAIVNGVCYFNSSSLSIPIGSIDPSSLSPATGSGTLSYACTANDPMPHLTQDAGTSGCPGATSGALGGALYMKDGAGNCLKYTLSAPPLSATGFAAFNSEVVTANIAVVDFQDKPVGSYSDIATLTIVY